MTERRTAAAPAPGGTRRHQGRHSHWWEGTRSLIREVNNQGGGTAPHALKEGEGMRRGQGCEGALGTELHRSGRRQARPSSVSNRGCCIHSDTPLKECHHHAAARTAPRAEKVAADPETAPEPSRGTEGGF